MEPCEKITLALVDAHSGVEAILAYIGKRNANTPHFYLKTEVLVATLAPLVKRGCLRPIQECSCWMSAHSAKTLLGLSALRTLYLENDQIKRHNSIARGEFWQAEQGDFLLFITNGDDDGRTTDYFRNKKVSFVFVGAEMPDGIADGLHGLNWELLSLPAGMGENLSRKELNQHRKSVLRWLRLDTHLPAS